MRVTNRILSVLFCAVLLAWCSESALFAADKDSSALLSTSAKAEPKVVGYFPLWEPERGYRVKDIVTRGAAEQLTHILLAFGG